MEKKVNIHAISENCINGMLQGWFLNAVVNYEQVKNALNEEKAFDLAKLLGKYDGVPAMVIGSGPTLIPCLPYIKKWKDKTGGKIYCGLSNINILMTAGIKPDFLNIYDIRDTHKDPAFGIESAPEGYYDGIPMITSPEYDSEFIRYWMEVRKNPIYFHLRLTGGGDNAFYLFYLKNLLPMAYYHSPELKHNISAGIYNVGCVANHELITAAYMGCDPIYLCGVNFGYPMKNDIHVSPMIYKGGKWVKSDYLADWKKNGVSDKEKENQFIGDNGVLTDSVCVMYKHAAIISWARLRADIYEASVNNLWGILDIIPKVDMRKVASGKAILERVSRADREKRINVYRKKHNYQEIPWSDGEIAIPIEDDGVTHNRIDEAPKLE